MLETIDLKDEVGNFKEFSPRINTFDTSHNVLQSLTRIAGWYYTWYLPNNNRMCVYCVREISLQLNQENGKSYGTGFFGKVQI